MCVRPADAKRADPGPARCMVGVPRAQSGVDIKGAVGEISFRLWFCKIQARRQRLVFQGQDGLKQPRHSGRLAEVPDVSLNGADGAVASLLGVPAKSLRHGRYLDLIAERRARPV